MTSYLGAHQTLFPNLLWPYAVGLFCSEGLDAPLAARSFSCQLTAFPPKCSRGYDHKRLYPGQEFCQLRFDLRLLKANG